MRRAEMLRGLKVQILHSYNSNKGHTGAVISPTGDLSTWTHQVGGDKDAGRWVRSDVYVSDG